MLVSSSGDDDGTYMNTLYGIIIMLVMMMVMVMMTMMMSHFLTIS
jgi:tetrahydromethanopterin S-methyltransferase subunit G